MAYRNYASHLPFLFGCFLSAALLFLAEPLIGKMLLPLAGGTPAVWNTCMFFFQFILLAGYFYAHILTSYIKLPAQVVIHCGLAALIFFALPLHISHGSVGASPGTDNPINWLLKVLFTKTALPLFLVSTSAPLLQSWLSKTSLSGAKDPYFMYGTSNAGSLLGLFCYPVIVEPFFSTVTQNELIKYLYLILTLNLIICGALSIRRRAIVENNSNLISSKEAKETSSKIKSFGLWTVLAALPSSLTLGSTTYLTTDLAPVPLLWVVPLALYLLSFIVAFSSNPPTLHKYFRRFFCLPALVLIVTYIAGAHHPPLILSLIVLWVLFFSSLYCHTQLVKSRPPSQLLTVFYLCIACGGMAGGVFNAIISPLIFNEVVEFPLVLSFICAVGGAWNGSKIWKWKSFLPLIAVGFLAVLVPQLFLKNFSESMSAAWGTLVLLPAALVAYRYVEKPLLFSIILLVLVGTKAFYPSVIGSTVHQERNFFGVLRVTLDRGGNYHQIAHGDTIHGRQKIKELSGCEPLSYYHRSGPAGDVFSEFSKLTSKPNSQVALIGLGAGALLCFADSNQDWTVIEVNPAVTRVANDKRLFTYMQNNLAATVKTIIGDGRLALTHLPDGSFDLLAVDAFSSDAIPIHLITSEALELYFKKLKPDGVLLLHISNLHLDLSPVLSAYREQSGRYLRIKMDMDISGKEGKDPSVWALMANDRERLGFFTATKGWSSPKPIPFRVWTDDFSNIISTLTWFNDI